MNLPKKPINQHSLQSLELWLTDLGALKDVNNPSKWYLLLSNWNATIIFEQEDLSEYWLIGFVGRFTDFFKISFY